MDAVNPDSAGQLGPTRNPLCDEAEVHLETIRRERLREMREDALRAASIKMRNEKQQLRTAFHSVR